MSNALVELHCHILPGIDDGAKDLDMSMSLIRKELQEGAAGIVFTPHFHYERISVEQFTARRKAAFLQVSAACRAAGLRLAGRASGCRNPAPQPLPQLPCQRPPG